MQFCEAFRPIRQKHQAQHRKSDVEDIIIEWHALTITDKSNHILHTARNDFAK